MNLCVLPFVYFRHMWLHRYTRKSCGFMHFTRCATNKSRQIAGLLLIRMLGVHLVSKILRFGGYLFNLSISYCVVYLVVCFKTPFECAAFPYFITIIPNTPLKISRVNYTIYFIVIHYFKSGVVL